MEDGTMQADSEVKVSAENDSKQMSRRQRFKNKFNKGRHYMNKKFGVEDPTATDKYQKMKWLASLFAGWGILNGLLLIILAQHYGALIPENKSIFLTHLTENEADIEVCVADTGSVNLFYIF